MGWVSSPPILFKEKTMKIKIYNDVFDIVKRLKEIDDSYYVVYDNVKKRYEVWSLCEKSMCFVVPYTTLDARTIAYALKTNSNNAQKLFNEIDKNNNDIVKNERNKFTDQNTYKIKEIFEYEKLSRQVSLNEAFCTTWV